MNNNTKEALLNIIKWHNKPYMIAPADYITDLSTPKEYGQKLLNRKRGRK